MEYNQDNKRSLRFGVLCSGTSFQRWQATAIRELIAHGHQVVVRVTDGRSERRVGRMQRLARKQFRTLLFSVLENRIFRPPAKALTDLSDGFNNLPSITCTVTKRGYSEYFDPADVATIREYRPDFLLRFGFGILRGDILSAARYGVWSFHHDDELKYRGGPAGFWEIFQGDPVSGAILQRLTDRLDGGIILRKGYLKTVGHSWKGNLEQLLTVSAYWPAQVADEIAANPDRNDTMPGQASQTGAPLFRVPGNLDMLYFLALLVRNRIRFYFRELFRAEIWNVGIIRQPVAEVARAGRPLSALEVEWLPPAGRKRYLADPFGYTDDRGLHILAEDYRYENRRAGISEILLPGHPDRVPPPRQGPPTPIGSPHPDRVPANDVHLSYPFVFQENGEVYCLPEASESRRLTLYRLDKTSGKFVIDRVLLQEISAVDPTLVFFRDRWWLFFTTRPCSNTHLFVYHAPSLDAEFRPHLLNPVKVDIRSARPAGTPFLHEGTLYRPAQDSSRTYGGRVIINRIVSLTPDDFREEVAGTLEPPAGCRFRHGLHTLSAVGTVTLIDGKTYRFLPGHMIHQIRERIAGKEGSRG
ncbi:MAG TPA: hypothetical protein PKG48_07420 [Bacteroidales bacterium]|nr:hypothetical protein [Bacteroidales bacterium]